MEDNRPGGTSDRDRKMMGSFEGYADTSDDDDDEKDSKKKKKQESRAGLFERSRADKRAEKDQSEDEPQAEDDKEAEPVSLEQATEEEAKQIIRDYAEAQSEDVAEDLAAAEPESVEKAMAAAQAAFLESVKQHEAGTEADLDAALTEAAEDLDLPTSPEAEPAAPAEVVTEPEEDEAVPPTVPSVTPAYTPPLPIPTPPEAARPPQEDPDRYQPNRRRAGQLLLMGGVGYLLGRRRGRIKTEAQLLPVQEKLEKEVKSLHDKVAEREAKIRQLAAKKVMAEPEVTRAVVVNTLAVKAETARVETARRPEPVAAQPETIGKFVLPGSEVVREPAAHERQAESMTITELLVIADKIERQGASVKEMYARGRLDIAGLRRVVHEYLSGDHLDRVLTENLKPAEAMESMAQLQQRLQDNAWSRDGSISVPPPVAQPPLPPAEPTATWQPPVEVPTTLNDQAGPSSNQLNINHIAVIAGLTGAILILLLIAWLA